MKTLKQSFEISYQYNVFFTENLFELSNSVLREVVQDDGNSGSRNILFFIDEGVAQTHQGLNENIKRYLEYNSDLFQSNHQPIILKGGETIKNDMDIFQNIVTSIHDTKICRHSYVVAIGGGAFLDAVGFASAISHRGVRHIRIPTTVLSQNDSGVGVKNGVNAFGKKNFLGSFSCPYAVINDFAFLTKLEHRDWMAGVSEAIKVALIKDKDFFYSLKKDAASIILRDKDAMSRLIYQCAKLHMQHIASGDAFEKGSSRPLDFGHWSAHKLEQLTSYTVRHGEAVAAGIALDATYSLKTGLLKMDEWKEIITLLKTFGFKLFYSEMGINTSIGSTLLLNGIDEFREHLGGELTLMMLEGIGKGKEIHKIDKNILCESISVLQEIEQEEKLFADGAF